MQTIKLGVIGLGHRALGLAGMLQNSGAHLFEVKAVCDVYPNKVNDALQGLELSPSAGYTSHQEMLQNDEIEAVMVETGAQIMVPICCDALRAGKHVMCDVPMMFTRQDAWDLVTTVEQTGLVYCMEEQVRFANFVDKWKQHIERREIGEPLFIQGEYIHPHPGWYFENRETGMPSSPDPVELSKNPQYQKAWRNMFKHPIKYISHELSPLLKILDDRVVKVSCYASDACMYGDAVEMIDVECALMQTEKGRTVRIINSFTAPRGGEYFHHWYHIMGTDGVLENERRDWDLEGEIIRRKDGSVEKTNYGWEREDNPFAGFSGGHGGLEAFVFQQFYDAVKNNSPSESDVYTSVEATLPGIIAAESAEAGGIALEVPDVRPNSGRQNGQHPEKL